MEDWLLVLIGIDEINLSNILLVVEACFLVLVQ